MLEGIQELEEEEEEEEIKSFIHHSNTSYEFLTDHFEFIEESVQNELKEKTQAESFEMASRMENGAEPGITYDRYKRSFFLNNEKVTVGEIISARHFSPNFSLPKELEKDGPGPGKALRRKYFSSIERDIYQKKLNKELAQKLSIKNEKLDLFKSKAYAEIAKREDGGSKQEGVIAEKMIMSFIEMTSIDRPDLGMEIRPSNAYQDVEEKIDFIITTKQKRKNVGIQEVTEKVFDEKSFGIQFTINTPKGDFKKEQIQKAKDRGLDVDDLLYIEIDRKMVHTALINWQKKGRPIRGPWDSLPENTKRKAIENIFKNILTEKQINSILNGI